MAFFLVGFFTICLRQKCFLIDVMSSQLKSPATIKAHLERCVLGTKNPNECVNSMVWLWRPKHKHHGVKVVRFAVCHFHSGAKSKLRVIERLSIPGRSSTRLASTDTDNKRKRKSELQASTKENKCRQGEQLLRSCQEEALREGDGVTYDAGGF